MNSSKTEPDYKRALGIGLLAGVCLSIAFLAGFLLDDLLPGTSAPLLTVNSNAEGYPLVDEVQVLLDDVYLRGQPSYTERQYAAIRGVLGSLDDPNTFFIEPPVAQSESDALAGTYGGIGVQLQRNEQGEFVLYPFPDSPAAEAGIESGAVLVAINDVPVNQEDQQDAVDQEMRGEVTDDNGVQITVRQDGSEESFFIPFEVINVPSVISRILEEDDRIGYVQILRFTSRTPSEVQDALTSLKDESAEAFVLDLRDNSGGLLQESIAVAGIFLDGGVVVYEENQDDSRTLTADAGGLATDEPLVVLVNRGTASAAELVAGAIRDRDRGVLIGQQTFGKGTVQQIFTLSDGSSIHVTSAEWFTPDRVPLAGVGLEPNISMIPDEQGRNVELGEATRYLQNELDNNSNGDS
jgi:carboxyl-terminal processing protease